MGVRSLGVALTAAIFTGMVFAIQSAVNMARFGAEAYVGPLAALAILRELGPVLTAILVGGKVASGITAELGSMRVTEQIDVLRTLGVNYIKRLIVPRVLAAPLGFPPPPPVAHAGGGAGGGGGNQQPPPPRHRRKHPPNPLTRPPPNPPLSPHPTLFRSRHRGGGGPRARAEADGRAGGAGGDQNKAAARPRGAGGAGCSPPPPGEGGGGRGAGGGGETRGAPPA